MTQLFRNLAVIMLGASALGCGAASAHDRWRYDGYYYDYDYRHPAYCRYDHDHRVHDRYYYDYYPADWYYRSRPYVDVRIIRHHRHHGRHHRH